MNQIFRPRQESNTMMKVESYGCMLSSNSQKIQAVTVAQTYIALPLPKFYQSNQMKKRIKKLKKKIIDIQI